MTTEGFSVIITVGAENIFKRRNDHGNHYMDCYTDILEGMLQERGLDPWKDYANNITEDKNETLD